ncbi:MAG: winged helix DNA-binding protein [Burkholderiaceae bacterium]|nr:winged helix DNA-binding protein [Burkholderiaceae bacterium]
MDGLIPSHEEQLPRPGSFRALPSFRVHLLAGMSARHAEMRFVKKFGLRLLEARIVGLVGSLGPLSLKQICQESDIEKSHASKLIDRLRQRGIVEKLDSSNDQRAISVNLTDEGRALHRAIYEDAQQRNQTWLAVLGDGERQQLLALVEKLIARTRDMIAADQRGLPTAPPPPQPAEVEVPNVALDLELARRLHAALGQALQAADASGAASS